jgi:predicted alpha/beta hydrolase family esterase
MARNFRSLNEFPSPVILTVLGLGASGPGHWQTAWEASLPGCRRVDLGLWDDPHRNTWVNKLGLVIRRAEGPVILAAHSLGCMAVAWWAEYEQSAGSLQHGAADGGNVIGALLVAPPDVEDQPCDRRLTRFAPVPASPLPFPTILVASRNDAYLTMVQARRLASGWASRLADAGEAGHINAQSQLGDWAFGRLLLNTLLPEPLPVAQEIPRALPSFRQESVLPWQAA